MTVGPVKQGDVSPAPLLILHLSIPKMHVGSKPLCTSSFHDYDALVTKKHTEKRSA